MSGASRQLLSGGVPGARPALRWHFQHGPIDLVIAAEGDPATVEAAHAAAWQRFAGVLGELVAELPLLRQPVAGACALSGVIARRMWAACQPFAPRFITPMAAVAGAVAEEIIAAYRRPGIARAWVNNGGDIALHLAPGEVTCIGLCSDLARVFDAAFAARDASSWLVDGHLSLHADDGVCGVATSGWRGRSHSLGIADSVTVLAATAAQADAAATLIANAVDLDDARIQRRPACELKDDSDLGERLVTVEVPPLSAAQRREALRRGAACAQGYRERGLIVAAALVCQGSVAEVGAPAAAALIA